MKQLLAMLHMLSMAASPVAIDRDNVKFTIDPLDMNGESITILTPTYEDSQYDLAPSELNAEIINDAIYTRNATVEEYHNTIINVTPSNDAIRLTKNATLAADPIFDLTLLPANQLAPMMLNGFFIDLAGFDAIALDQPWWNNAVNGGISIGGKLFAASNDIAPTNLTDSLVVAIEDDEVASQVYDLVESGRWTIDSMRKLMIDQNAFLDGDARAILAGTGQGLMELDDDGMPQLTSGKSFDKAIRKIASLYRINSGADALFTVSSIADAADKHIVPLPKLSANQETYYSLQAPDTLLLSLSVLSLDSESTAIVANSLQYVSWDIVTDCMIEQTANMSGAAPEAENMLRYIEHARLIDIGAMLDITTELGSALAEKLMGGDDDISDTIAKYSVAIAKKLEKIYIP